MALIFDVCCLLVYFEPTEEDGCLRRYESVNLGYGYKPTIHVPCWSRTPRIYKEWTEDFSPSAGIFCVMNPESGTAVLIK